MYFLQVYDGDMAMRCVADLGDRIGYRIAANGLSTASFALAAEDPCHGIIQAHDFVRLMDAGEDMGLFRVIGWSGEVLPGSGQMIRYECEHAMATLLDETIDGDHILGSGTVDTRAVLQWLLEQQTTKRWQLGRCDFTAYFEYSFSNTDILSALFSVSEVLAEPYLWVWDTSAAPWTVSLVRPEQTPQGAILYRRNMTSIKATMDASSLITRLYPKGYGEGVNQLTIRSVNGGKPYIDADTAGVWGIKSMQWSSPTVEDPATLLAEARAVLDARKNPVMSYEISAIDLSSMTGMAADRFAAGQLLTVMDGERNIRLTARVQAIEKADVYGSPQEVKVTLSSSLRDSASDMGKLAERVRIAEMYSQGSTIMYPMQVADNVDADHPLRLRFFVPQQALNINQVIMKYELQAFRSYEKGAAAGGGSIRTSSAAGSGSISSEDGGMATLTKDIPVRVVVAVGSPTKVTGDAQNLYTDGIELTTQSSSGQGAHVHGVSSHRHKYDHSHSAVASCVVPPLTIDLPAHSHRVNIPGHSHEVEVPPHTHEMVHGIYEGGRCTSVTVRVDGREVPEAGATEVDILPYLAADASGKIRRGEWHTVELTPNGLGRINANLYMQVFVQSRGGVTV